MPRGMQMPPVWRRKLNSSVILLNVSQHQRESLRRSHPQICHVLTIFSWCALQTTPVYKQMYDVSTTVIHKVQDLSLVQTVYSVSANRLYPYVKPYASPLVLKAQPYVDEVVQQLKPIFVAA